MEKSGKGRLALLDTLRGLTLISMILYHACWDAVYMLGADWPWYGSRGGYIWQQSICWTFILLSGFCVQLSKRLLRRGLIVFGAGALVMLVTNIVLPEDRVIFGVLTLIGSCMLLMVPLRKLLDPAQNSADPAQNSANPAPSAETTASAQQKSGTGAARSNRLAVACLIVFAALFVLFKDVNAGVIGTGMLHRILPVIPKWTVRLPEGWYRNLATAYIGFPPADFFSTDYFSLLPWCFLYLCGYELHLILRDKGALKSPIFKKEIKPLSFMGRNSLLIYLLHQPVLYLFVILISATR